MVRRSLPPDDLRGYVLEVDQLAGRSIADERAASLADGLLLRDLLRLARRHAGGFDGPDYLTILDDHVIDAPGLARQLVPCDGSVGLPQILLALDRGVGMLDLELFLDLGFTRPACPRVLRDDRLRLCLGSRLRGSMRRLFRGVHALGRVRALGSVLAGLEDVRGLGDLLGGRDDLGL